MKCLVRVKGKGEMRSANTFLGWWSRGRPRRRFKNNREMDLKRQGMRAQLRASEMTVMDLLFP